ncbi:hypothetical protein EC968_010512, partial [Mortierella alpina]
MVHFFHKGHHEHVKPSAPIDITSLARAREIIKNAPESSPKSLQQGTASRIALTEIHSSFANLDRLATFRRKVLSDTRPKSTLSGLATWEQQMEARIIQSSCITYDRGHICLQTEFMRDRTAEVSSCMQSDSVHGFIEDDCFKEINVTFTSV